MLAALLTSFLVRLIPVGLVLLAVQNTVFIELQPFGVVLQPLLALAATAGAVAGPERGALAGFVLGLMLDLATGAPLGSSAITMGIAGVLAGWIDVIRLETTWYLIAVTVLVAAGIGEFGVPTMRYLIGENDAFVPETLTVVPVVAISSALMSIPLAPLARWAMRVPKPEWRPDKVDQRVDTVS